MVAVAAALFGFLSYAQLGMELMPDLAYPTLTVRTVYPGGAPEEIEAEVTSEIEAMVGTVEGLVKVKTSTWLAFKSRLYSTEFRFTIG